MTPVYIKNIGCFFLLITILTISRTTHAQLALTSGNNATTTPNVATAITGFQIVGNAASTTPVKLFSTYGTLSMTTTTGLTFDGTSSGSVIYFSGTVANINNALSTLTYTRSNTGTDTLEISLVPRGEAFFTENNHLYKFISGTINWNDAYVAAQNQVAYGVNGYLATISSSTENAFVSGRLTGDGWIGGSDSAVEGVWRWMSGPEAGINFWNGTGGGSSPTYASWAGGEPNQSGNEDCAQTYVASGNWNDLPCTATVAGYVVEFGTATNTPSVIAKNISVVTADVPAVTALSPANGSVTATSTQNLVITFSKTVTANSGNILIKRTSDDATIETIAASSSQVTGGGTTAITINPNTDLIENVSYYVVIPSTAFKDASNNSFNGITGSSTWAFTILDLTAPVITDVATSSVATSTATIAWATNENASSKIIYSVGSTFTSTTTETDTSPRVTSHTKTLSELRACTTFNYKVISADAAGNYATSTANTFTTTGCPGGAPTLSATTTQVAVASSSTSTLTSGNNTVTVTTPPNVTASSSSIVIQIKSLDSETVFATTSKPASMTSAARVVFDVTALINATTVLDSFDAPVTISYTYSDEEIAGLEETTLRMYHYHDDAWLALSDCSVNTTTNTITCSTPSFSIFGIFGTPIVTANVITRTSGSTHYGCKDTNATNYEYFAASKPELCVYAKNTFPSVASTSGVTKFSRTLKIGSTGADVKALQKFLNANGFTVATTGAGSIGNETTVFGKKTAVAVKKFQEKYADKVLKPAGFKKGTGIFGPISIQTVHNLIK